MGKKRQQHYVFQGYLQAWADNKKQIVCLRERRSPFKTHIKNVAQERDFYKIERWNEDEVQFYKRWISKYPSRKQALLLEHLALYQLPYKNESLLDRFSKIIEIYTDLNEEILDAFNKMKLLIDEQKINTVEDFHNDIEGQAMLWLNALRNKEKSFYTQEDKSDFINYLCIQYFRTRKIKDGLINTLEKAKKDPKWSTLNISPENIHAEHLVHMFTWEFQSACTDYLLDQDTHMTLLINSSKQNFLTSDQPVINLKANHSVGEDIKELVFYYPISPRVAITVNDRDIEDEMLVEEALVHDYNNKLITASYQNLYSLNEEDFNHYFCGNNIKTS
ncbi:DUF4238 domain-containing protein [Selenomonas massiliensis]|uniref:DUF4238 domain-containing protein n=1 Tax=Selenomonas massiliensis TaxID=2058293 RepID=UPI000D0ED0D8|nr:DUF4238 domain-containing protein [Selenomonas massiliensis]